MYLGSTSALGIELCTASQLAFNHAVFPEASVALVNHKTVSEYVDAPRTTM